MKFPNFEPINMFEKRMFFSSFIVSQVIKGWCPWQSSLQIIATMGVSPFLIPASWPQQVEADGGPPKQFVKAIGALEDYIEPLVLSSYHNFPNEMPIAYWGRCKKMLIWLWRWKQFLSGLIGKQQQKFAAAPPIATDRVFCGRSTSKCVVRSSRKQIYLVKRLKLATR